MSDDDALQPPEGMRTYAEIVDSVLEHLRLSKIITDTEPGGIARTLVEAMAREMAEAYALLQQVYRAGFIDSAEAVALDHLVALLDVKRIDGRAAIGVVVFRRDPRVAGHIDIKRGTRVLLASADKKVEYQTADDARLPAGRQDASVQVLCPLGDDASTVVFGQEPVRARLVDPIAGIGAVELTEPTRERGYRESDQQLRSRVKGLLEASGGGTSKAIEQAVLAVNGVEAVRLRDASDGGEPPLEPGVLEVIVNLSSGRTLADAGLYQAIESAALAAKGPGVHVRLAGVRIRPLRVSLHLVPSAATVDASVRERLEQSVVSAVRSLISGLAVGEGLSWNRVVAAVLGVDGIADLDPKSRVAVDGAAWTVPQGTLQVADLERLVLVSPDDLVVQVDDDEIVLVNLSVALPAGTTDQQKAAAGPAMMRALGAYLDGPATSNRKLVHAEILDALHEVVPSLPATALVVDLFKVADQTCLQLASGELALEDVEVPRLSHAEPTLTVSGP